MIMDGPYRQAMGHRKKHPSGGPDSRRWARPPVDGSAHRSQRCSLDSTDGSTVGGSARALRKLQNGSSKVSTMARARILRRSPCGVGRGSSGATSAILPRSAPVKIDPKVFFANERTFLAWLHVSVILAGASVAIVAFTDSQSSSPGALYGVILLPVSIAFILYAMIQYTRRASMIRRKSPGPYMDIAGPTVLTVILMLSIVTQFSIKLYTLM